MSVLAFSDRTLEILPEPFVAESSNTWKGVAIMGKPRLLLGDDHRMFLDGLRRLLNEEFDVVDAVTDGRALFRAARRLRPDLVVADLTLPTRNGLEVARDLLREDGSWRILLLTMHADPHIAASALESGVKGYLVKDEAFEVLGSAIRGALDGRRFVSPCLDSDWLRSMIEQPDVEPRPSSFVLTRRQKQVLALLAEGLGLKEVASRLGISTNEGILYKNWIQSPLRGSSKM